MTNFNYTHQGGESELFGVTYKTPKGTLRIDHFYSDSFELCFHNFKAKFPTNTILNIDIQP